MKVAGAVWNYRTQLWTVIEQIRDHKQEKNPLKLCHCTGHHSRKYHWFARA